MNKTGILVSAALAGLLATGCSSAQSTAKGTSASASGECHGVNACKGNGECGGKDGSMSWACAGNNTCKGKGWLKMSKSDCDAKGGQFKES